MFRRSVGWGCCERDAAVYGELVVVAFAEYGRKIVRVGGGGALAAGVLGLGLGVCMCAGLDGNGRHLEESLW